MRPIATLDCETDPFKKGRIPKPFIWGLYDGDEFWHTEDLKLLIERVKDEKIICYAHNGGKFDYHYMLDFMAPYDDILIINGRIAKFSIGVAEFRDSFNIIPVGLAKLQKDEFDYTILERDVRYKTDNWKKIVAYLESDCKNLYRFVTEFIDRYGLNLTQAGTAMKQWQLMADRKAPRSTPEYYEHFSKFYFGGRVQCFKQGIIDAKFSVFDINSAYPRAMLEKHPIGLDYVQHNGDIDHERNDYGSSFFNVRCCSKGAFPCRNEAGGLWFPDDNDIRDYTVTGWELCAARDTATISEVVVIESFTFSERLDFADYITHFYNERRAAQQSGDKAGDVFSKLLMNSLYGKFGSNPDDYEDFMIIPPEDVGNLEGTRHRFAGELGPWILAGKDLDDDDKRFYNVATAASITGYVRALLWRSICATGRANMLYCDTDSISTTDSGDGLQQGNELGQWKHEGDFDRAGIGGKKLYIFRPVPGADGKRPKDRYKTASKGARLSHAQLWKIANGGEVLYEPENPSYSVHSGIKFINRKIRMTY